MAKWEIAKLNAKIAVSARRRFTANSRRAALIESWPLGVLTFIESMVAVMPRSTCFRYAAIFLTLAVSALLLSCGSSNSMGGSGTGGGTGSLGGFAAGIGGAGQTSAAHFLIAMQVPGVTPFPTMINSDGTLQKATATLSPYTVFNPMAITGAIDPSGSFLYQAAHPGLWTFTIDRTTGNLNEMSTSPYDSSVTFDSVVVDQLGKFLYAYAAGAGTVYAYSIQSGTGQLSAIAGSPFPAAITDDAFPVAANRTTVSQDDKYLYVATASGIVAYSIDANTGALTSVNGSPFGASAGAGFSLTAPSSGFLYETISGGATPAPAIYGYSIDSSTGSLTALSGSPFGPSCGAADPSSPANGKFLFAAGCGMYQIDASTGALTFLSKDPEAPYDGWSAFDPASGFVWIVTSPQPCFSCVVGVDAYQVDANTGNMTLVPNSFFAMTDTEVGDIQSLAITH